MPFSKRFPRDVKGSNFPVWEDIELSEAEERSAEEACRKENTRLMRECLLDAKEIVTGDPLPIAIALFEKRASHAVFWKERLAKEKFDKKFSTS